MTGKPYIYIDNNHVNCYLRLDFINDIARVGLNSEKYHSMAKIDLKVELEVFNFYYIEIHITNILLFRYNTKRQ